MAYYLMVEKTKGTYHPINISVSKYYPYNSKQFSKPYAHTLQEIDYFTTQFDNELELKERLVEEGILTYSALTKQLSIRTPKNGVYNRVPYNVFYQDEIEYLMDPSKIIKVILEKYYQNDFLFIKKLAANFTSDKTCKSAVEVMNYAQMSIYNKKRYYAFDEVDKNGDLIIARMLKTLVLKYYTKYDGTIEYKDEVNYRNLHDLIAFTKNYYSKNKQKQESTEVEIPIEIKVPTPVVKEPNKEDKPEVTVSKTKKRSKKKYDLDGQTSFDV